MLQSLRNATKSWVMKAILIVLAGTFVVFFGNSFVGSGGSGGTGAIVEVGDVDYNAFEVNQAFSDTVQRAQSNPSLAGLTQEQAIQLGLLDRTINEMVTRTLVDLGAQDLGLVASDADASALVRQVPQFQNSAGRFDRIQFETFLRASNLSEQQYINQLRGDLLRSQLLGTINAGVTAPATMVERFYDYNAERRVAEFLTIDGAEVPPVGAPDEATLAGFYEANKASFETPEYRSGLLVSLTLDEFAREIGVGDDEIAAAYNDNAGQYVQEERRDVATAVFASQEEAQAAAERIRAGEDFATVVEEVTGAPPADLGPVTQDGAIVDEIGTAAFALAEPGLAGPFESPFGWNLANVRSIEPRTVQTLADVRDEIAHRIALDRARERIFDVLESFEDALAGGATLEEAAQQTGIPSRTVGPVAANGAEPGSEAPANPDRRMLATLFGTEPGVVSPVIERNTGGFFALRVDQVDEPRIPPLADIRDKVTAAWMADEQALAAEKIAGEIAEQARSSASLIAAAAKAGYTAQTSTPFDRIGNGAELPIEAVDLVFEAKVGDVVTSATTGGAVVARLVEIVAPPGESPERDRLKAAIAQSLSNDLQVQLTNALRREHPVEIDSAELQRLYAPQ